MNKIYVYAGPNGKLIYLNFHEEKRIVRIGNQETNWKLIPVQMIAHSEIEATKDRATQIKKRFELLQLNEILNTWKIEDINAYIKNEMNNQGLIYRGEITAEEDIKTFELI
jgi:hypothetical protein